ncbi:MAG: TrkH family potassium uptake protein, partial [Egibacteraceae bacterium]
MLIRPDRTDLQVIGLYTGKILTGVGLVMLLPAVLGLFKGEFNDVFGFVIGAGLCVALGQGADWRLRTRAPLDWSHAMAVVALSWLVAPLLGALPLFLSGHYGDYLDAYFDAMSGFATAGLAVINDLDHLSDSVNLWRHTMQYLGGQGLAVVALSLFTSGSGATGLYLGEGREDRILPNVVRTARFIWVVSLVYGGVGSLALWLGLLWAGMPVGDGLLHAVQLFMAAFDTGGFAPTSASVGFYHSGVVEGVIAVLMVAGMLSFALHYQLWRRRAGELTRNLETRTLAVSITLLFVIAAAGLVRTGTYDSTEALVRRGFFHLLSAHSGTGFGTVPGRLFVTDWGTLAPAMLVVAMALGGMAGSTTGGIKALRVGLAYKLVRRDLRAALLPADAVVEETYHSAGTRHFLRDAPVGAAVLILLLYLALYLAGAFLGLFYDLSLEEALFESTSAAAAVGLSVGVVSPDMPAPLQLMYAFQMWIGRLEFVSVFALFGYGYSMLRGRL